jgi:two-component system NtrC family sensor kinase
MLIVTEAELDWSLSEGRTIHQMGAEAAWQHLSRIVLSDQQEGSLGAEMLCVVLGLQNQGTNLNFCRRLRSIPRAADWPVVALVSDAAEAEAALEAGASDFCFRQIAGDELGARILRGLSWHQHERQARRRASLAAVKEHLHQLLLSHLEIETVLKEVTAEIAIAARTAACGVVMFSEDSSEALHTALSVRAGEETSIKLEIERLRFDLNANLTSRRPATAIFSGLRADAASLSSEVVWPLLSDGQQIGVLACAFRGEFDEMIATWLDGVAIMLSAALENARLYARAQRTSRRLVAQVGEWQQETEMQKRLTEKVIDSLPVSLYVVDRGLRIVAWNRNREVGGQGIDRQRVIGRSVVDIFSKMPRQMLEQEFERVFVSGESLRFEQESNVDGVVRHWLISKIPMRLNGEQGDVTHVITLGEEITEQKKMNEAIIHAEKLTGIGRLASGVVHELNNPLATIAACAEALQGRLSEATVLAAETRADFDEYLKIIHSESFRCKTITNSLLEFSRQRQAEKTELEINYLVTQTLHLIKHHPKFKRLQIINEMGEGLPPVLANEAQMKQVFIAIISNAFDAMDEQGSLRIRTGWHYNKGQRFICAEFADNGCGIQPADVAKIFEPFFTTKPFGQGTGLGLAVCYGIVSDHRGKIEVESQVGRGTTMRVLLPPYANERPRKN